MLADIGPLYMAFAQDDVQYTNNQGTFLCSFYAEQPVFLVPVTRVPKQNYPFVWDISEVGSNFWDIIKNQVHIFPSMVVDFGLVLSQKEIPYYIWNAYTEKSVYILEPVTVGDIGTTFVIDIAGNFTLQPGKGTPAMLTVYVEGPISSATNFEIQTTVQGQSPYTYTIVTKAVRIIAFPFLPDWDGKVSMNIKFDTVISKSTQNKEQRRPLYEKPQRTVAFSMLDKTYGLIANAFNFAQSKTVGIPVVHEMFQILSIYGDKMGVNIVEKTSELWNLKRFCNYIMILDTTTNVLVAKKITTLGSNSINIENPILEDFENPSHLVGFPMLIGLFKGVKPKVLNGNLVSWSIEMMELVGDNQPQLTGVPNMPATLDFKFAWSQEIGFETNPYRDIGEFPGTVQMLYQKFPLDKNPIKSFTGTFILKSRLELFNFLDFMCGAKGRYKKFEFLFPLNEFQLIRGEYEGVNIFRVRNNYFAEQAAKMVNMKIRLTYRNFTLNTTITSAYNNSGYTTITTANATTFRIYDEDYQNVRIEQWKTVRFDLDDFTVDCLSGTAFIVKARLTEVYE